jgi:polar amino acid transport system substrate-binding protein
MRRRAALAGMVGAAGLLLPGAAAAQPVLKVGTTPAAIPFHFLDAQNNTVQGVMVDLIREVGKDAGFEVRFEPMQFSALIGALTSNRIDVISAAMFVTAPRQAVMSFSAPIYSYGEALFVPKADTREYARLEDLRGRSVGAQSGTAFVKPLQDSGLFADVKLYDTIPDILRDVNGGLLQGGFADYPIVAYNLQQGRYPEVRLVRSYKPGVVGQVAIGVRKGDADLLARINAALAKLRADGRLQALLARWGLE